MFSAPNISLPRISLCFAQAASAHSLMPEVEPAFAPLCTSEVKFNRFEVKRTIADFEVAMAKIERFDAINQQLLSVVGEDVGERS